MERIRRFAVGLIVLALCFSSVAYAEERSAKEYMAEGIRAAYDNMHLVYQAYYDENGELEEQPGGFVAIEQEWDGDKLISRTYLGADGEPINRIDGYARAEWKTDENDTWYVEFFDTDGNTVPLDGLNLICDMQIGIDSWSDWMTPNVDSVCRIFFVGQANLGRKMNGDSYVCQIEIEYRGVEATEGEPFLFRTQGAVDGEWEIANIWYPNVINLSLPPDDGVMNYCINVQIDEKQACSNFFDIEFRCDYWSAGSFRVRNIKIEKGHERTTWSPGL